jgi:parallel beta-helix repeat protein
MPDIFLSYSRKDTAFMQTLRDHLRGQGFDIWTDESLESGTPAWTFAIDKEIRSSKALVVILSPDARDSIWVEKELALAELCNVPIFPLLYRGDGATAIPFRLVSAQYDNYMAKGDAAIAKLTDTLRRRLNVNSPVTTPPPTKDPYTIIVAKFGAADFRTINDALEAAPEGATIKVRRGLYHEGVVIKKPVEIVGEGERDDIVLESSNRECVVMQAEYAVIRGLTIRLRTGGEHLIQCVKIICGRLMINFCDLTSDSNLIIHIAGKDAEGIVTNSQIHDCDEAGISVNKGGNGFIENSEILRNGVGVILDASENLTVRGCVINFSKGEAIYLGEQSKGVIENCNLRNNSAGAFSIAGENWVICRNNIEE